MFNELFNDELYILIQSLPDLHELNKMAERFAKINSRLVGYYLIYDSSSWYNCYIYIYIFIILINNSQRKDKGNQWHDGGCISDTKFC